MLKEQKDYWKEMRRLNVMVQQENIKRMNRIKEHKRKRIWYTHSALNEKNSHQRNHSLRHQCFVRTQLISEQQNRNESHNYLNKLMKADPERKEQREFLGATIQSLNQKFALGLDLTPSVKRKGMLTAKSNTSPNFFISQN